MNAFTWILLLLLIVAVLYILGTKYLKTLDNKTPTVDMLPYIMNDSILTGKELEFYISLKPIADELQLVICPKVRIADIVSVKKGIEKSTTWFNKISQKHIDFVLCDSAMKPKLLIEVDDKTHDTAKRQQRDIFVDKIFDQTNIKLLHIRTWGEDLRSQIAEALTCPISEQKSL